MKQTMAKKLMKRKASSMAMVMAMAMGSREDYQSSSDSTTA